MSDVLQQQTHCTTCGIVAPPEQLLVARGETFCPSCASDRTRLRSLLAKGVPDLLAGVMFIAVWFVFIRTGVFDFGVSGERVVVIGIAVYLLLICIHEVGHAIAAVLTGRTLVGVVLGHGAHRLARFRLRGVIVEVRANLLGGATYAESQPRQSGEAFFILGGVGAESIVLLVAYFWNPDADLLKVVRTALILFAAHDIVSNLWPRSVVYSRTESQSTDGRLLWLLIRGESAFSDTGFTLSASDVEAGLLAHTDDQAVSFDRAAADFAENPDHEYVRYRYGNHLMRARRWSDANEVLRPLADSQALAGEARAVLLNNLAWSALMRFDDTLLDDADHWSAKAAALWPVNPNVSGTRGAVLVMTRRPDLGMPLLVRAYRCHSEPESKALVSAFGALGAASEGELLIARQRYAAMIKHDPTCGIRRQVEMQIAEPEAAALAALISDEDGSLDTGALSDAERLVLPAMATLALAHINGHVPHERLADEAVVGLGDDVVSAGAVRVAARRLLATQAVTDETGTRSSRSERARRRFMELVP